MQPRQPHLKRHLMRLRNSPFAAHVAHLGTGTLAAHLITLAASPVLARLFTPEEFGLFSLFHSLVTLLSLLATGTYEYAIVLPRDDRTAKSIVRLTTLTSTSFSALLFLGLMAFAFGKGDLFGLQTHFLLLLPLGVLTHAGLNISTNWLIRRASFKRMSAAKMAQSLSMGGVQIGAGLVGWTGAGLLAGYIAGRMIFIAGALTRRGGERHGLTTGWRKRAQNSDSEPSTEPSTDHPTFSSGIRHAARLYRDHPRFVLLSSLLSAASIELPVLMITSLFGNAELGHYGLAFRVLMAPVTLIGTSVGHVFFKRFSQRKTEGQPLSRFLLQIWGVLALLAVIPFGALFLFGEPVFAVIFGEEWRLSGQVASIMAPMLAFTFLIQPTSKSMLVLDKQRWMPLFSVLSLGIRFTALITGAIYFDFLTALWLMVGGQILSYLIHSGFVLLWSVRFDNTI